MESKLSDRMWLVLHYLIACRGTTLAGVKDPALNALSRRGLVAYRADDKYDGVWWYLTDAGWLHKYRNDRA